MTVQYQCSRGHLWGAETGSGGDASTCPVCGSPCKTVAEGPPLTTPCATLPTQGHVTPDAPVSDEPPDLPSIPGYTIQRQIGKGGMGVVYHALHRDLGRAVALKVILSADLAGPGELARFKAEAETAAQLQHPHIVSVLDVGQALGRPFYTMELVPGGSLKHRLARGPFEERRAAELLVKLARAAHHAHQHGVIHRDLKPDNVLMTDQDEPKITDFGIAKRQQADSAVLTQTGSVLGTPAYMAPEQASGHGKEVGPAADVYALGAILYECLAGKPPFRGDAAHVVLHKVLTEDPQPPSRHRPGLARDLDTICLKCLHKAPEKRYASAAELADDLERYLVHRPIVARRTPAWERAWKWSRRHPTAATLLLLLLLALVGGGLAGWTYYDRTLRVHHQYYASWVKRWGAYEGLGKLTAEQVRQREYSYRFHVRAGRVERVDVVNQFEKLTNVHPDFLLYMDAIESRKPTAHRECYFKLERDAKGTVTDEVAYDRHDRLVWRLHYQSPTLATFTDAQGFPVTKVGSGATFVAITRDENGLEVELRYLDRDGQPRPDADGAFGWRLENDALGQTTRMTLIDAAGKPFRSKLGYATATFERDHLGNTVALRYFDEAGRPTRHKFGMVALVRTFDEFGRPLDEKGLDEDGRLVRLSNGSPWLRYTYQGPSDWRLDFLNEDGKPDRPQGIYSAMTQELLRADDTGRTLRQTYLDHEGRPMRAARWMASEVIVQDIDGRPLERSYFDLQGRPTLHREGYAIERMKYDDLGNMIEWAGFDTEGRPTRSKHWVARLECRYDPQGRRVEERVFGPDGRPTLHKDLYHRTVMEYDRDGRKVAEACFGIDGQPTRNRDGYSRATYAHDAGGRVHEVRFFGPDGKPTWHKKGYAVLQTKHDARGLLLSRRPLAVNDQPIADWDNLAEIRYEHDAWGNRVRESHLDATGAPANLGPEDVAVIERTFDRWGNALTVSHFSPNGERLHGRGNYWQKRSEYEDTGRLTRIAYLGLNGEPCLGSAGVAGEVHRFPNYGAQMEVTYLGVDGQPTLKDGFYARMLLSYDERDLLVSKSYYGLDLKQPVRCEHGYARAELERDARGREAAQRYFDEAGKPTRHLNDYARLRWVYDDRDLPVEEFYLDDAGQPYLRHGTYASFRMEYDERGNRTAESFHDRAGKLVRVGGGYARLVTTYSDRDRPTARAYFDAAGAPCVAGEGMARTVWRYNDCDETLEQAFYGVRGELVIPRRQSFARRVMAYDLRGNLTLQEYFNADNRPMLGPEGASRSVHTYNEANAKTSSSYYDTEGREMRPRLVVMGVTPGGRGAQLGLRAGDVVVRYDGKEVKDFAHYDSLRTTEKPGDPARVLEVRRGDRVLPFTIAPGKLSIQLQDRLQVEKSP